MMITQEKLIRFFDDVWDVSNLMFDKNGQLWFMSGRTVCRYNFHKKQLKKFEQQLYFSATTLCLSENRRYVVRFTGWRAAPV